MVWFSFLQFHEFSSERLPQSSGVELVPNYIKSLAPQVVHFCFGTYFWLLVSRSGCTLTLLLCLFISDRLANRRRILQIANVGYEKIDADAIGNAVASDTLFIHGSSIEGGSRELSNHGSVGAREPDAMCEPLCSDPSTAALMPTGVSTVCDASCGTNNRFDGYLCGAGDSIKYGNSCRLCYTDQTAALEAEANLRSRGEDTDEEKHVIMCDTLRPPSAVECSSKCDEKKDTVSLNLLLPGASKYPHLLHRTE